MSIDTATLDRHIQSTPGTCGGRPRIAGRRIAVGHVAEWHLHQGMSVEEIAAEYDLDPAAVHAAMAYYYDHKVEIDDRSAADAAFAEQHRRGNPSLLRQRLTELGRDDDLRRLDALAD